MATPRAIEASCNAVVDLLRDAYDPAQFDQDLEFQVYTATNFPQHMAAGVSLFLYRIFIDGTHRIPGGRYRPEGGRDDAQLPLELHFLLTAWGRDASMQYGIAGWMMRVLEDTPTLPSGLLNRRLPGVFRDDEAVEIVAGEIATEDMMRLWELIGPSSYQLSVPYLARNLRIESETLRRGGGAVQDRVGRFEELVR
jgi:Pvc16 N-terminal domain